MSCVLCLTKHPYVAIISSNKNPVLLKGALIRKGRLLLNFALTVQPLFDKGGNSALGPIRSYTLNAF